MSPDLNTLSLTLFTTPKQFKDRFDLIQRNALFSWTQLQPRPNIIVFGNSDGAEEAARDYGVQYYRDIECNELGTPYVPELFAKAQELSKTRVYCYLNADIILLQDFVESVLACEAAFPGFLMIGQRNDLPVEHRLDGGSPAAGGISAEWKKNLTVDLIRLSSRQHVSGIDYFCFTPGLWEQIPRFVIGRPKYDNWLVYDVLRRKKPVIDATETAQVIHQNHDYSHKEGGRAHVWEGPEAEQNKALAGPLAVIGFTSYANHVLTPFGVIPKWEVLGLSDIDALWSTHLIQRAVEFYRLFQPQVSILFLNEAVDSGRILQDTYYYRALGYLWFGFTASVIDELRLELQHFPGNTKARILLAFIEDAAQKRDGAVHSLTPELNDVVTKSVEQYPEIQEFLRLSGEAVRNGNLHEAERLLHSIIYYCPDFPEVHYQAAMAFWRDGNHISAYRFAAGELRVQPHHPGAQFLLKILERTKAIIAIL